MSTPITPDLTVLAEQFADCADELLAAVMQEDRAAFAVHADELRQRVADFRVALNKTAPVDELLPAVIDVELPTLAGS